MFIIIIIIIIVIVIIVIIIIIIIIKIIIRRKMDLTNADIDIQNAEAAISLTFYRLYILICKCSL